MKKLVMFGTVLLVALASTAAFCQSRFERSALEKQKEAAAITHPSHEPLQFGQRRGGVPEDWPQRYDRQHDPENVRLLARLGSRYERLHFYKGFGLAFEMPEIRRSAEMARVMHGLGMKVSLYVGGSMFVETFYRETPAAVGWEQRDQYDRPVPYLVGTQTFRHMPCPNEQGYRDYIKRVLDVGIDTVKADEFFFDNYFLREEPKSCRCQRCIDSFHHWLKKKYPTPETARARFGYPDTDWITVNEWDEFNRPEDVRTVDDPVLQEWIRFRCESLAGQCREFYRHIKSRYPKLVAGFNLKGLYSLNRYWYNAVYHPLFAGDCDFFCFDIEGAAPGLDPRNGALVSEIRSYKMARRLDMACSDGSPGVALAEEMAFNNQKYVEGFGWIGAGYNHYNQGIFSPLAEFFREYNDRYYTATDNVTDVAVLRSWPSMAYSIADCWIAVTLAEQVLIQHRVPFDIIFDEHMHDLSRYRAIVLAGQESLSSENVGRLEQFASRGGAVLFTGNTADYNEFRRSRLVNPLLGLMGLKEKPKAVTVRKVGSGRLVYVPEIVPGMAITPWERWPLPAAQWVLPANHDQLCQALTENLPGGLSLEAEAPLTTAAEIYRREQSKETIVHFVNYDQDRPLAAFTVRARPQFPGRVKSVTLFSPERDQPLALEFAAEDNVAVFTLPGMNLYSMVVIAQ